MTEEGCMQGFLKDNEYQRGSVPMTKEEVRWLSLLKLRIGRRSRILDIGAGTGSVTVGAALLAPEGEVTAVERNPEAVGLIRINCERQGVPNVRIIAGAAPEALEDTAVYDGIFIGGSGGNMSALITWCAEHLSPGGKLVINTVTVENGAEALNAVKSGNFEDIEAVQVSIARGRAAGSVTLWEAQNPVMILSAVRRQDER